jgi:hypothetical protein
MTLLCIMDDHMQSATRMEASNTYLENCHTAHAKLCVDSWYHEGNGRTWLRTAAGRSRWPCRRYLGGLESANMRPTKELVHQRTICTILASREDVDALDRGGGGGGQKRHVATAVRTVLPLVKIRTPGFLISSLVPKKKENMRMPVQTPSLMGRTIRWPSYWQASFYRKP